MRAVSNTTPLRYLIAIEQVHLLGKLFEKVFVPVAVYEELSDPKTPEIVRHGVASQTIWFEVREVDETAKRSTLRSASRAGRALRQTAESLREVPAFSPHPWPGRA